MVAAEAHIAKALGPDTLARCVLVVGNQPGTHSRNHKAPGLQNNVIPTFASTPVTPTDSLNSMHPPTNLPCPLSTGPEPSALRRAIADIGGTPTGPQFGDGSLNIADRPILTVTVDLLDLLSEQKRVSARVERTTKNFG